MKEDENNQQYHQHWRKKRTYKKKQYKKYNRKTNKTTGQMPELHQKTTTVDSLDNKTGHHHTNARQKRWNALTVTKWDFSREYAAAKPTIQETKNQLSRGNIQRRGRK